MMTSWAGPYQQETSKINASGASARDLSRTALLTAICSAQKDIEKCKTHEPKIYQALDDMLYLHGQEKEKLEHMAKGKIHNIVYSPFLRASTVTSSGQRLQERVKRSI